MIKRPDDPDQLFFTSRAELIAGEKLVQTIDEVVNGLDLAPLYACWSEKGRSFYDPSMMLKLLFFAYSDGEHHSRDIVQKIRYDIRYQYFAGSCRPSHITICRFRTIDADLLASYFVQIVSICNEFGLLDTSLLAIDGSKIKASASRNRTLRRKDLDKLTEKYKEILSADAASDLADIGDDEIDDNMDEPPDEEINRKDLKVRIRKAMERLEAGEQEVNLTDSDARFMKTSDGGIRPCYNGQIAVDKNQLIVAADICTNANDTGSLKPMIEQSESNVGNKTGKVLVDGGYYSGRNMKYIDQSGFDVYMPMGSGYPEPSGKFHRDDFVYNKETNSYLCPAGERLTFSYRRFRHGGIEVASYRCSSQKCRRCQLKSKCTTARSRELNISEVYHHERAMKKKLATKEGRAIYDRRKVLVEPVFGNIKFNLGFRQFVLRGLKKVKIEFLLMCIAHNLKKMAQKWSHLKPVIDNKTTLNEKIFLLLSLFGMVLNKLIIRCKKSNSKFEYAI